MTDIDKLSTLGAEKVAFATSEIADLQAAIRSEQRLLTVACAGVVCFALVDIGVIYHFATSIGAAGNAAEAATWADQLARLTASLVLFVAISAATSMAAHALRQTAQRSSRIAAGALSAAFALGSFIVAAALAWPAFAPAVDGLVSGSSTAAGMDAPGTSAATPLWLRLSLAMVVVAAGVLGGLCELAAAAAFTRLRGLQSKLGWPQHVAELGQAALAADDEVTRAQKAFDLASSEDQQKDYVRSGLHQAVDAYVAEASGGRHGALDPLRATGRDLAMRAALEQGRNQMLQSARAAGEAILKLPLGKQQPDQGPPALPDASRPAKPDDGRGGATTTTH